MSWMRLASGEMRPLLAASPQVIDNIISWIMMAGRSLAAAR